MSIQQILLGAGGVPTKTYVEDVFSTYLYKGDDTQGSTINNGIDLSGEGGLVWLKSRTNSRANLLYDTVRGATKFISTSDSASESTVATLGAVQFNNNGFNLGSHDSANDSSHDYASWTFRKAKRFFDIVTYTGTGSKRTVSHNLGCQPGMIAVKRTDGTGDWEVWHKALGGTGSDHYWLRLNSNMAAGTTSTRFGDWPADSPTSTAFTVGTAGDTNGSGSSYVAYLFAGGESTAATARSVDFDGSGAYLSLPSSSSSSLRPGTGDFCIEAWLNPDSFSNERGHYMTDNGGILFQSDGTNYIFKKHGGSALLTGPGLEIGQWTHVAVTRSGTSLKMFYNGTEVASATDSTDITGTAVTYIGSTIAYWDGKISNLRLVIGSAVYTSSFRPPTAPLTNITNTVLLCCNNSSTTGSTVTPGTITATSSPTAKTDSPFDDPSGFKFGENGDQNVIKCGSYIGNGSATGPEINLGWEPQWVLVKNTDLSTEQWFIFDNMRGIITDGNDYVLEPSTTASENNWDLMDLTSTGFKLKINDDKVNGDGHSYIYTAIRRPDGYCAKLIEDATKCFDMDYGDTTAPAIDTGFITDFYFYRNPNSTSNWFTSSRLTQGKALFINDSDDEYADSSEAFDYNTGAGNGHGSNVLGWAWKRHAGFDVVTYKGNGVQGRQIPHSLSKTPEMIWIKNRSENNRDWIVGHKGLDGGTNPWQHYLKLNSNSAEDSSISGGDNIYWGAGAPNATHFNLGYANTVNEDTKNFIAMLFSSVENISKVGSYDGSNSGQTITTGFQPRFLIIKAYDSSQNWWVLDTTQGWGSGDENYSKLNGDTTASTHDFGAPTSTGFTLTVSASYNTSGTSYLYYAHA